MKNIPHLKFIALCHLLSTALALLAGSHQAMAQLPIITSFSQDGLLVCSNLQASTAASVEWASSLAGPWRSDWAGLTAVTVNSNGTISVSVPMFYRVLGKASTPAGMAIIDSGWFTIGDTLDGESDAIPTNVYVSAFYMDTNQVSYSQWQTVYKWATNNGYGFDNAGAGKASNHPVQTVNWYDAVKWCNARSQLAGLTPVYCTDAGLAQVYTNGDTDAVYPNWYANGYRLPTEAEWEEAARGGLNGQRFPWGNTISWSQANYYGDPGTLGGLSYDLSTAIDYDPAYSGGDNGDYPYTSPVGSFAPNGYGLYDMAGNVFDWCWDWYAPPPYPTGSPYLGGDDPRGPALSPIGARVWRDGGWNYSASSSRCASRSGPYGYGYPLNAASYTGFRCVKRFGF